MNKIAEAFRGKKAFIPFLTGGDPDIATTEKLIPLLAAAGADVIEIGIPFSDPIAEGPVIQEADERALSAGCTTDALFQMVGRIRKDVKVPLLFMTYINPVFTYGKARFMENCAAAGIDGVIIPDLPFEERDEVAGACRQNGITQISMIAPTSRERITTIAKNAEGFLYCVSSLGVTGMRNRLGGNAAEMIRQAKTVTDTPCAVGFGVSTPAQAKEMAAVADGVIIGSAIVRLIGQYGQAAPEPVAAFVRSVRQALDE